MAKTLGTYVREWRKTNNLSQKELAELAGLQNGVISHLENGGRPWNKNIEKLSEAMKVSPNVLMTMPFGQASKAAGPARVNLKTNKPAEVAPDFVDKFLDLAIKAMSKEAKAKLLTHIMTEL